MGDRIEKKLRQLIADSTELNAIKVFYRGEPMIVPVSLYPFAIIYLTDENEANDEGYRPTTGIRYYRYDGYVAVEVVHRDVEGMAPDASRFADIPSYIDSKTLTQAAFNAIMTWGGPSGGLNDSPVISSDTREFTVELRADTVNNSLSRRSDNVSNRGSFSFHVFTRRLNQ